VKVRLVPSAAIGADDRVQYLISIMINETISIDAGCIGLLALADQHPIEHVFLTHSHLDHLASLPIFLDNVFQPVPECVNVYGSAETLRCIQQNFFNDAVWPDFVRLSTSGWPFLKLIELKNGVPVTVAGVEITPVLLDHVVPTFAFVVDDGKAAVAWISDTAPSDAIWKFCAAQPRLKLVMLEASFPNHMHALAKVSKHLTPSSFRTEYAKLGRNVPVMAVHIKPAFYDTVVSELTALNIPQLFIGRPGVTHEYL